MSDQRHPKGLIDTSVVIDAELVDPAGLPAEVAISAITLAELVTGPHATADPDKRARRHTRNAGDLDPLGDLLEVVPVAVR